MGANFSCAIVTGGQVRCWGYGAEGELGYPGVTTVGAANTPASVGPVDLGAGYTATAISSGDYHTCAIRNDRSVVCWGYGGDGRLGYGDSSNVGDTQTPGSAGPVNLGPGRTAIAILRDALAHVTAGGAHTCAILDNHQVVCWGFGFDGQLGYGNQDNISYLGSGQSLAGVACASPSQCTAVDSTGREVTFDPNAPGTSTPSSVDPGNKLGAVACVPPSQCTAVDNAGDEVTFNPATRAPTTPTTIDTVGPVYLGAGRTAVAISAGSSHT